MSSRVDKLSPMSLLRAATRGRRKARWYSLANLPLRAPRMIRGSLGAKIIVAIAFMQIAVLGAMTMIVERF